MKRKILDAAERTVQEKGLKALSFQHLANDVGLSKPSVFHYFKTKESIIKALIDRCQIEYVSHYDSVIGKPISAPEKLEELGEVFRQNSRKNRLCMLAVLSTESMTMSDETRERLHTAATKTIERFTRIFKQGRQEKSLKFEGSADAAAMAFLAMLQGLQILGRALQDPDSLIPGLRTYVQALRCQA